MTTLFLLATRAEIYIVDEVGYVTAFDFDMRIENHILPPLRVIDVDGAVAQTPSALFYIFLTAMVDQGRIGVKATCPVSKRPGHFGSVLDADG